MISTVYMKNKISIPGNTLLLYNICMKIKILLLLITILILAFVLRFYKVTQNPPSLNWDEVSIGYNAYSILKTGRDEWGEFLPLHFKSYGEYKLPAQIYSSIPGIYFFGLNELGVRITPVLYGTLTILVAFLLGEAIFENSIIGLLGALLLAISPWHIHLTRASFESSFAFFWVSLAIYFLVKYIKKKKSLQLIFSVVCFAVSVYTYNSTRVFTPLFLLAIILLYKKDFLAFKRASLISLVIILGLLLPLVPFVLSGQGGARYKLVSVADDPGLVLRINESRGNLKLPQPLPSIVHNKVTYLSLTYLKNYLSHFSIDFLFLSGAPHKQHHSQNVGELYLFQLPFILYALYDLFRNKNSFAALLITWILISFIPVAITNDSIPHALRTLVANMPFQLLTAFGIFRFVQNLRQRKTRFYISIFLGLVTVFSFLRYYLNFLTDYPVKYSRDWQYGNKQVVEFIKENFKKYDLITYTRHFGEPHMFTLFYLKYDPAEYQTNKNLVRFETYDWVRVLKFDKLFFPDLGDTGTKFVDIIASNPGKKMLFIGKHTDFPDSVTRLKQINFLNGESAFDIVEYK